MLLVSKHFVSDTMTIFTNSYAKQNKLSECHCTTERQHLYDWLAVTDLSDTERTRQLR